MGLKTEALRWATGNDRQNEIPSDLRGVGTGTMSRAVRTCAAVELGVDWLWPYWLERQLDPRSATFVPRGQLPLLTNVTQRNWTAVGTVSSAVKGIVDPRGLLTPAFDGWSLDWWIGAEDRWHFPSRESAVRQQLVGDTPVVETAMRIPGGDAVQRVYAVPGGLAVMEITNATPAPVAVGLAIRPYNPEGVAVVERIGLLDRTVTVDGRPALLMTKPPSHLTASTFHDGDVVHRVLAEDLARGLPGVLRCQDGLATATFLFPLAHRQTLRVAVPMTEARPRRNRARRGVEPMVELRDQLPESDAVVRSWQAQTSNRGMRLVLPEGRLASAVEANRRYLLLFHEGSDVVTGAFTSLDHSFRIDDVASLLSTFDRYGFHGESAEVLASFPKRQRRDGSFPDEGTASDATGVALSAMAEHWRLTGSIDAIDAETVMKGAAWIERSSHKELRGEGDHRSFRGLLDSAAMLRAMGADPFADQCDRWAASMPVDVDASMALDAEPVGSLVGHTGLGTSVALQQASVELEAGDRTALDRLGWLLDVASPTFTWPEAVHPGIGGGCLGDGHDGRAAADFLSFVRRLLVRETGDGGLALCSMLPDAWTGQAIEVHDAPTHVGALSFAVRYHGDRPALLWDLKARDGAGSVTLTAPGLDPTWSTTEPKGEALLAATTTTSDDAVVVDVEGSFS